MKPMLAVNAPNLSLLNYPVVCSPKIDGIRCLIIDGKAVSRTLKPIPNEHIREYLSRPELSGLDGELICKSTDPSPFAATSSTVMSHKGTGEWDYIIFDNFDNKGSYLERHKSLAQHASKNIIPIALKIIDTEEDLLRYEEECLASGYEGVMIRSVSSPYKQGRSTVKEGYLLKLKRFNDAEAIIEGVEELIRIDGTAADTLGALKCVLTDSSVKFNIGTGFTEVQRKELWATSNKLVGQAVKYKYFELSVAGVPRFPVFIGVRSEIDYER